MVTLSVLSVLFFSALLTIAQDLYAYQDRSECGYSNQGLHSVTTFRQTNSLSKNLSAELVRENLDSINDLASRENEGRIERWRMS